MIKSERVGKMGLIRNIWEQITGNRTPSEPVSLEQLRQLFTDVGDKIQERHPHTVTEIVSNDDYIHLMVNKDTPGIYARSENGQFTNARISTNRMTYIDHPITTESAQREFVKAAVGHVEDYFQALKAINTSLAAKSTPAPGGMG